MDPGDGSSAPTDPRDARFATTNWSAVLDAADVTSPRAQAALGALYQAYSYPLYGFVRRKGHAEHDAQDLLHDFFCTLIEKNYLKSVTSERGRFRSFLLGSLKHFLANDWHHAHRQKRGGQYAILSLDELMADAEQRFQIAAQDGASGTEVMYDREWAATLLARVLQTLRQESADARQFEALKIFLSSEGNAAAYQAAGATMGLGEGAVKVAVHRLRQRFQAELRREIAGTVGPAGEVEEELRYLAEILRKT
jgi:DNA-directed RNA polymerase specialized sigma24 family protein